MKRRIFIMMTLVAGILPMNAVNYLDMEPLKLEVPEMKPELVQVVQDPLSFEESAPEAKMDLNFFKQKTNPGVKPYKVMDDLTFVGVPLFIAGIIAKSEKNAFRQNFEVQSLINNSSSKVRKNAVLLTDFKTKIDDYSQFFGPVMTVGLKVAGVEGRSDWPRLAASAAMSYGIMALFVNTIKNTAKEMRPDGSTANSWPSGHTATSFVGATILHKEYGLTRSPWYSVAGYTVATATGIMRVLNNRHWVSDVLSGAGIGIMSTEIAYALSDLMFKGKGLLRNDLVTDNSIVEKPSFFSISMGIGLGNRDLNFDLNDFDPINDLNMKFQPSTAVAVEGAYFFNKYLGVGGRLRVKSSPINGWDRIMDYANADLQQTIKDIDADAEMRTFRPVLGATEFTIVSDHLTEFAVDAGVYFNLPLSRKFALGSKLLAGRSIMQALDLDAQMSGKQVDYTIDLNNESVDFIVTDKDYYTEWDYCTVEGNNSYKFGTGLSLTYAYKNNFAWKVFVDYDYTRKTYTLSYNPTGYIPSAMPNVINLLNLYDNGASTTALLLPQTQSIKKNMNSFVIGGSFAITF